jgi:uncharacterized protein DUF4231
MAEYRRWLKFTTPKFEADKIESYEEFIAAVEKYVLRTRDFYDSRARWHRRFFRLSTILIILIGASLPLAAASTYPHREFVLGTAGVVIAGLTGLRAFYHWDQFWVLNRNTEMLITRLYLAWKASNINPPEPGRVNGEGKNKKTALALVDYIVRIREDGERKKKKAALELVEYIVKIREDEAGAFFKVLSDQQGTLFIVSNVAGNIASAVAGCLMHLLIGRSQDLRRAS